MYVPYDTEEISIAYKSEYNNDPKNQLVLLMINDNEKWHYLALKNEDRSDGEKCCNCPVASLKRLLRAMTSKHHGQFYCLNFLHCSYSAKNRFIKQEKLCNKHNYCHIEMPKKYNNILKYNDGKESLKSPFVIELDIGYILKKEHSCQNNPEKSFTERKSQHEPSGWAIFTKCSFDITTNRLDFTEGKIVLKGFVKN